MFMLVDQKKSSLSLIFFTEEICLKCSLLIETTSWIYKGYLKILYLACCFPSYAVIWNSLTLLKPFYTCLQLSV